jgi:integrase/recombinase XerC
MHQSINRFLDYIRLERGYSEHTVTAYRGDLARFDTFMESLSGDAEWLPTAIDRGTVRMFLGSMVERKYSRTSVARAIPP